jgi:hypothetical protein
MSSCGSERPDSKHRIRRPGSGDMAASASGDRPCTDALSDASEGRCLERPNFGRRRTRKASAPCLREAFVMAARKKHCQKCDEPLLLASFPEPSIALRSVSSAENMRSKSSLVSSSRPGRSDSIIAFSAGRSAGVSSFRIWLSNIERNSGRTESEANEGTEARPGKYMLRSRARASFWTGQLLGAPV